MKIIFKTIIALILTAFVPVVEYVFLLGCFVVPILLFPTNGPGTEFVKSGELLSTLWVASVFIILPLPFVFGYVFLLGLPALLLGWYFRTIRWWSTLIAAFMIGALPSTIYVVFAPLGWGESTYLWQSVGVGELIFVASTAIPMGFAGLSGGLVFWLLWRYWISPHSPAGRPLPRSPRVEINSPGTNELKAPDTA